ncbi:MAG TPA: alpha/beta hydrolase [Chitinophagaceae bacterium]
MEKSVQITLGKMHYRISGSGFPVVLLHGLPFDGTLWNKQFPVLESGYRVVIPDLPGSGLSELLVNDEQSLRVDEMADSVQQLLQQEQIETCIMIGHSMGGYVALSFAERYPGMLRGLGLTHATAFADNDERKAARDKNIAKIRERGANEFLKGFLPPLFGKSFSDQHSSSIESFVDSVRDYPGSSLISYFAALRERPDRTQVLQRAKVPVLFIIGTEDPAAPISDLLKQVYLPAVSHLRILEGSGHVGMWESPQEFNTALLRFVEACT